MTARLVRDACFNAPIPNYATDDEKPAAPLERIPHLYHVDPIEGADYYGNAVDPEFIVDISTTFALKQKMLACHDSQRAWLQKQHGMDEYLAYCERQSSARGKQIGVAFGEGFTQYKGHPYPADNLLWEIVRK
jgi:LmbE family N-acetylglucosaminyl deacetylase